MEGLGRPKGAGHLASAVAGHRQAAAWGAGAGLEQRVKAVGSPTLHGRGKVRVGKPAAVARMRLPAGSAACRSENHSQPAASHLHKHCCAKRQQQPRHWVIEGGKAGRCPAQRVVVQVQGECP